MAKHSHTVRLLLALVCRLALTCVVTDGATTTHLRFYMHDTVTSSAGSPATAVRAVRGETTLPGDPVNRFGDLYVIDDPLTKGPGAASPAVGRAQGFYLFASRFDQALLLRADMLFKAGPHNGSSLSVLARDAILDDLRELPVVAGTGRFRGVAGYGLLRTHSFNASTNNAVLRIDMYLAV